MSEIQATTAAGISVNLDEATVAAFKASLRGQLLAPNDPGYDATRRVWNVAINRRPALIVRCAGVADVMSAVRFARTHDLLLAVRAGGHNVAGRSSCDSGLMIDLQPMKGIHVDPVKRRAHAEAGVLLGELDHETQAFGLATTLGVAPDTGIAGLTLGGGYGWLEGKYGLSCDNLLSVDIVTAEGQLLTASETENSDLFWGIRGAGANFGVVVSFEFQLHPVSVVLGGLIIYSLDKAGDVLRYYNGFSTVAPDELSCVVALLNTPAGSPGIAVVPCWCGALDDGEKALHELRTLSTPIADLIRPMSYIEMQKLLEAAFPVGHRYYWKSSLIRDLSDGAIETLLPYASKLPSPLSSIGFQQIHGAASRVGVSDTAFPHRFPHHDFFPTAIWSEPSESEACIRWSRECWEAMQPYVEHAAYVNDLGDEGEDRVRAAYGPNYERLVALKRTYDPTNLFRLNQNVRATD